MPRRFELREPVTGRVLGHLDLVEDMEPGAAARTFFRQDVVQVEAAAPPAAARGSVPRLPDDPPGSRRGRR